MKKSPEYYDYTAKVLKDFLKPYNFSVVREEHFEEYTFYLSLSDASTTKWDNSFIEKNILPKINSFEEYIKITRIQQNMVENYKKLHSTMRSFKELSNTLNSSSIKLRIKKQKHLDEIKKLDKEIAKLSLIEIHKDILLDKYELNDKHKETLNRAFKIALDDIIKR